MRMTTIAVLLAFPALGHRRRWRRRCRRDRQGCQGLYLLTDYPAVSVRPGTTSTVSLRLQNYGLPPERFALIGGRHAGRLDRDAARRRAAGRRRDAGDRSERRPAAAPRRAGQRRISPTQTLTVKAAAGEGNNVSLPITINLAKELPAKLDDHAAAALAARHAEIELRLHARHQERQRAQSHREPRRDRAAQFRDLVHRGLWHPGTVLGADRCRRLEGREAQGAAAVLGRCRHVPDPGDGDRPPMPRPRPTSPSIVVGQPRLSIAGRDGLVSAARRGRRAEHGSGHGRQ